MSDNSGGADGTDLFFSGKVYVAGHTGLIGSAFVRRFRSEGHARVITRGRKELDLTDAVAVDVFFRQERPEYVVLAAGRVGGITDNLAFPADYITENLAMALNVIRSAHLTGVRRLLFFGSSCMYPRECSQPMRETQLLSGKPEPTSMSYAMSKLAGIQMCLAYNQQYGEDRFVAVIPNSVYGPHDNFDPEQSHVLSALLRKFHEARAHGAASVTLWGTGKPRRELIYVDDMVDACLLLLRCGTGDVEWPVNVGVGEDYSIRELAEVVAGVTGYRGSIEWDVARPDGAPRKLLDSSRLRALGWRPKVGLRKGVEMTYQWFLDHVASESRGGAS